MIYTPDSLNLKEQATVLLVVHLPQTADRVLKFEIDHCLHQDGTDGAAAAESVDYQVCPKYIYNINTIHLKTQS